MFFLINISHKCEERNDVIGKKTKLFFASRTGMHKVLGFTWSPKGLRERHDVL